jgi:hypothetical protein
LIIEEVKEVEVEEEIDYLILMKLTKIKIKI